MIDPPSIVTTPEQHTAFIHLHIPRTDMPSVFGPAVGELIGAMAAQGVYPAGPCFAHHRYMEEGIFDFELSFPVASPVQPAGRMQAGVRPSRQVAQTLYHGPYEGLSGAWGAFMNWMESQGHPPAADLYETYVKGPESSSNPADWITELTRPLAG